MKIVTFFSTLMQYAKDEVEARKSGNLDRIAKAAEAHKTYRQLCLKADEMRILDPPNTPAHREPSGDTVKPMV
jgi:hypothetical protein